MQNTIEKMSLKLHKKGIDKTTNKRYTLAHGLFRTLGLNMICVSKADKKELISIIGEDLLIYQRTISLILYTTYGKLLDLIFRNLV